ncbi:MAG: SDR family NAD(P)-dependent oxidoreductase [Candidatus Heimdallarchaeota archaeon]|nr:SDR family NAD(P)-dependent oxidoreductase [Candidatus Heimdallarchaeota archaeon]
MSSISNSFRDKFGPWALIAGASEGMGAAFAKEAARKGLDVILVARREKLLEKLAAEISSRFNVRTRIIPLDLTSPDLLPKIAEKTDNLEIGLLIYNAALSPIGPFLNTSLKNHQKVIDLNCRGPMTLSYYFGEKMKERGEGGIVLMASLAGLQGSPLHAHYSATKAYNINLAESLWYELGKHGVKVITCAAGAIATPNYLASKPKNNGLFSPKVMTPDTVAEKALKRLTKNNPFYIPGCVNKLYHFFMRKFLSRKGAVKLMGNVAEDMYGKEKNHINP